MQQIWGSLSGRGQHRPARFAKLHSSGETLWNYFFLKESGREATPIKGSHVATSQLRTNPGKSGKCGMLPVWCASPSCALPGRLPRTSALLDRRRSCSDSKRESTRLVDAGVFGKGGVHGRSSDVEREFRGACHLDSIGGGTQASVVDECANMSMQLRLAWCPRFFFPRSLPALPLRLVESRDPRRSVRSLLPLAPRLPGEALRLSVGEPMLCSTMDSSSESSESQSVEK